MFSTTFIIPVIIPSYSTKNRCCTARVLRDNSVSCLKGGTRCIKHTLYRAVGKEVNGTLNQKLEKQFRMSSALLLCLCPQADLNEWRSHAQWKRHQAESSPGRKELLEETSSPVAPTCPQGQGSSHWAGLVLPCSAPFLPPPETSVSVSLLGRNLSAGTATVTNTGQWCYLWVELAAALCAVGLVIDDFLALLWCQEMHVEYLNPKCQELLGCFCQRVEEKEDRQWAIWEIFLLS